MLGSWLFDKSREFGEAEQRMLLRAENERLRAALVAAHDDIPEPGERGERILAALKGRQDSEV